MKSQYRYILNGVTLICMIIIATSNPSKLAYTAVALSGTVVVLDSISLVRGYIAGKRIG